VSRVNDGLTQMSGSSGWRGSVMVNDMSVATTARSRSTSSRRRSPCSVPDSCWSTSSARCARLPDSPAAAVPSVTPESPNPVAQSSRPSVASRCSVVADEPRRAESRTATGSPATGSPRATSDSGERVSLIRWPPRSVRPAASPHSSMSTGSRTRSPVSSMAGALA
jgi:hypothetical protein